MEREDDFAMRPKILIVEYERAIAENIPYALETDGFETHCISTGTPAISLLDKQSIDLIILDIGLPNVSGLELCKQIRKSHNLPIISLTARSDEIDRVPAFQYFCDMCTSATTPLKLTTTLVSFRERRSRLKSNHPLSG